MNDPLGKQHKGPPSGSAQAVAPGELLREKEVFLRAARRARASARRGGLRLLSPRRIGQAAAAFAALLLGAWLLAIQLLQPAQADVVSGVHGIVYSLHDQKPVPGLEIRRIRAGAAGTGGELVVLTDSQGTFDLPAHEGSQAEHYIIMGDGRKLDEFETGIGPQFARGELEFRVDYRRDPATRSHQVLLEPGQQWKLRDELLVALDAESRAGWNGTLVEDKQWPSNFNFGQVAGGIFELQGTTTESLTLSAYVAGDIFKLYEAKPDDLQVLAHSENYYVWERDREERAFIESDHDVLPWRNHAHRGWYVLGRPIEGFSELDLQRPKIKAQTAADGEIQGAWITWTAHPGTPYALLIPPAKEGQAVACWIDRGAGKSHLFHPAVRLLGLRRVRPQIYDVIYHAPDGQAYTYQQYPYRPARECYFQDTDEPRGRMHTGDTVKLETMFKTRRIPGSFSLHLMDFTTTNYVDYTNIRYTSSQLPGAYEIEYSPPVVGQFAQLKLKGDLARLAAQPAWDFYCDNVADAYGEQASMLIARPACYNVRCILREKSGNIVFLERSLPVPDRQMIGFEPWWPGATGVLRTASNPPESQVSVRAVSTNAVASPAAYSYFACGTAGPLLFFDPPPEFHGTPLKDLRLKLNIRGISGDALPVVDGDQMYLNVEILFAEPTGDVLVPFKKQADYSLPGNQTAAITDGGHSWNIQEGIKRYDAREPGFSLTRYLQDATYSDYSSATFKIATGLDLKQLPPEHKIAAVLKEYEQGPHFGVRYASSEKSQLRWDLRLWNLTLQAHQGILVSINLNDYNRLYAGQWEIYSGGEDPSRLELETSDGRKHTAYIDYSSLADE